MQAATIRALVLSVVNASDERLTGRQIASLTGLSYKQAIDALNYLFNTAQVKRTGHKFSARWHRAGSPNTQADAINALESAFFACVCLKRRQKVE